ncbi:hypothetical protein CDAR_539231 [Caerostris darwini]|uniref:Uncharacterized protein n=1 Tax=Caerostris darwini TaxID=1538125 RepID=A0AAV4SYL7_9ARAC|nr:hypothetical protein CDAR_539231 [Caerostris darwini]
MKCSTLRSERALQKAGHPLPRTCTAGAPLRPAEWSRPLRALRSSSASLQQSMRGAVAVSTPPEGEGCRRTSAPSSRRQRSWSSQPKVSTPRTPLLFLAGLGPTPQGTPYPLTERPTVVCNDPSLSHYL